MRTPCWNTSRPKQWRWSTKRCWAALSELWSPIRTGLSANKTLGFTQLCPPPAPPHLFGLCVCVCEWLSVLYNVWDGSLVVHRGMDNVPAFSKASEEHRQRHGGFLDSRPAPCHGPFSPLHQSVFYVKTHSFFDNITHLFSFHCQRQINLPAHFRHLLKSYFFQSLVCVAGFYSFDCFSAFLLTICNLLGWWASDLFGGKKRLQEFCLENSEFL